MKFATNIFPNVPLPEVLDWATDAERGGYEFIGVPDSPLIIRESYATCAAIAMRTERIGVSPLVTNPVTRHPSVAAAAIMTIDEMAPGRPFAMVGTGDSAVSMVGERPGRLAEVVEYIEALRGLCRGETVSWRGNTFSIAWPQANFGDRKIWMSCSGAKSLHLAGQIADGVVSGFGMRPENIAFAIEQVGAGARSVGRNPDEVEIWWHPIVTLARSWREEHLVGLSVHFLFEHGLEGKQVPADLVEPITTLHTDMGAWRGSDQFGPETARRAIELGVYDYLFEREGGFAGSAQDLRDRVASIEAAGAKNLILAPYGNGRAIMNTMAADVMPHFATSGP